MKTKDGNDGNVWSKIMIYFLIYIALVTEIWKEIPWYDWYKASSFWRVFSAYKNRVLSSYEDRSWYLIVQLKHRWKIRKRLSHRLIASAFYWESDLSVNHILGIKKLNNIFNLEYCTLQDNTKKWYEIGIMAQKIRVVIQYNYDMTEIARFSSLSEASIQTGIGKSNILRSINKWWAKGYKFRYL